MLILGSAVLLSLVACGRQTATKPSASKAKTTATKTQASGKSQSDPAGAPKEAAKADSSGSDARDAIAAPPGETQGANDAAAFADAARGLPGAPVGGQADAGERPANDAAPPPTPERFVLLLPQGPVVVDLLVTLDGRPLKGSRTAFVQKLVDSLAAEHDGTLNWGTALESSKFLFGSSSYGSARNRWERDRLATFHDRDKDGKVSAEEAEAFFATFTNVGPLIELNATPKSEDGTQRSGPLWNLLDDDADGRVDIARFESIEALLAPYDFDRNDWIDRSELSEPTPVLMPQRMSQSQSGTGPPCAMLLDEKLRWDTLRFAMEEICGLSRPPDDRLPLARRFVDRLDTSQDGYLSSSELKGTRDLTADLVLDVRMDADGAESGISATVPEENSSAGTWQLIAVSPLSARCELLGMAIDCQVTPSGGNPEEMDAIAGPFKQYDTDANGYLEMDELTDEAKQLVSSFEAADSDGDGKLYLTELRSYLDLPGSLARSAVRIDVRTVEDSLFAAIDTSHDGRLSLRELRRAAAACRAADTDGDGQLSAEEMPSSMVVRIARRDSNAPMDAVNAPPEVAAATEEAAPRWFEQMDRNRDGDVSDREFLGTAEQFRQLDSDGDGLLSLAEAKAVTQTPASNTAASATP